MPGFQIERRPVGYAMMDVDVDPSFPHPSLAAMKGFSTAQLGAQFDAFWSRLTQDDPAPERDRLLAAYGERHRAYHNLTHIADCFDQLTWSPQAPERPMEMEAAIWFHDVVYKPFSATNEADSAAWAGSCLAAADVEQNAIEWVEALIVATQHTEAPDDPDTQLLIDIDLSILGRSRPRFEAYEAQIRREYRWVPGPLYRKKRGAILRSFLDRRSIFSTAAFRERYEQPARDNLAASLALLSAG